MIKDASSDTPQGTQEPIRSKDGYELPEDMNQQLRDAVWAGLANKMHEDKELICKQYGHIWVEGPENTVICKRCSLQKMADEETTESSVT